MTNTTHAELETLSALVEGELDVARRSDVERHVASCDACAARLDALRALLAEAEALPEAVEPPAEIWQRVRAGMTGPTPHVAARRIRAMPWSRGSAWALAAAGLVLVVASSWITSMLVRQTSADPRVQPVAGGTPAAPALPASVARIEAGYLSSVAELEETLALQRDRLAPRTIATIERSLRTIDEALAEARRALAEDPGNRGVLELFTAAYEHKLDLLRRAAELSSST